MSLASYLPAYRNKSDWHQELQSIQVPINRGKSGITVYNKII